MTNCLPTMWYQYLSSVWQYCKLSLNLSQPSLLLPLVKFFNASHPGTAHTHTLKVFWYLQPSFPRKHPPGWFIGMTTKSMWRGTHMCSHFSLYLLPQHVPMSYHVQFWWAPAKWRLIIVFLLVASWHWIYTLLSTHTHSFPSAGRTPSSWLAYPSSRTTDCGEQTNKHDLKTFCTMNSQISPDLCLPWHDCYNQQRQPWDYTKITWDIIIKSVGKIRHWNIFWVYLQQPLWSPPCRGSHHRDATATWAPKPSPRSNLNAFLGTLDDTFGPYPR